ncbi:AAA family ATPase [Actinoplanes sp. NEAU-A12]|uniref:AAA family ATPase n=1 Tax=Actinoplanes sandaracinus TaxID=3045177 RepID=A0ABT6WNQ1_9ACTN|nr:AAA family ATPase [Actinoplanes sandaracinus]MDI6101353.1 AAA family ATPase [Actinoplanes sandaracinus]
MTELEPQEPAPEDASDRAAERARDGVRAWVRSTGRRTRSGLRSASPYAILAFLTASVVAPVAGAGLGASEAFSAALDQVGGLGSNFLADTLNDTAKRLRDQDPDAAGRTGEQWRDAIAADLLPRLAAADEQSRALHEEVSRVLRGVDAVGAAIAEAAVTDDELRHHLEAAFRELGLGVGELGWMLADVRQSVDGLRQQFAVQSLELNRRLEEVRRHLAVVAQERLPAADEVPPDVPGGAVPPYPGLVSFQPEDAPRFRGRETQIAQLLSRLAEQAVGGPPLIVTGVSGVGKSSLLRAGLLPALGGGALGEDAATWAWVLTSPGARPLADLVTRLHSLAAPDAGTPHDDPLPAVRKEPHRLGRLAARAAAAGHRPVIVVDQFEELFTQCPDQAERLAYVTALTSAAPALVVIAVRSDFYPDCVALPPLAKVLAAGHVVLGPLDAGAVRRAVVEPAEHAGLTVESGLPDLLLHDLGADGRDGYEPGALPLLAHALRATWDRREGIRLTVAAYRDTGGIRHAIADTAEKIYLDLPPDDRDRLRDALLALVTVTGDGTAVRRRGERAASDSRVLRRLVRARLVTVGADTVEISHEALLTSWPRLAGWVAEAREDLLLRQSVTEAARDWDRSGRDPDLLPRGSRLLTARERVPSGGDGVPPVVGEYLAAGGAAAEREQAARERATRRLRRVVAGLAVALLLAVAGGLAAVRQQFVVQASERESRSRQYAAESVNALVRDDVRAVRLALDAWAEAPTVEARGALLSAQMGNVVGRLGTEPGGFSAAVSPDGSRIAIGHDDGTVRLWNAATLQPAGEPLRLAEPSLVKSVEFSPDGRFLASGALAENGVTIWEAATGRALHTLDGFGAVAWLPGASTLVASRDMTVDGTFQLGFWDAPTGRLTRSMPTGDYLGFDLAVSPDGRHVAIAKDNKDTPAKVWQLGDGREVTTIPAALGVDFAPDGTLIAVDRRGLLTRWEVPSGRRLRELNSLGDIGGAGGLAVTADGFVAAKGGASTLGLWALDSDTTTMINNGNGTILGVAASASGQMLVVTGANQPTTVFRRGTEWLPNGGEVFDLAYSPDGSRLAAGGEDGRVRVWDAVTRRLITSFPANGVPRALLYAPDGTLVVATDRSAPDKGARAVELHGPDGRLESAIPLDGDPKDVAISPDGALLAVPTGGGVADIFDRIEPPGRLLVYDLRQRRALQTIELGKDRTSYAVAFSPDGTTLLATVTPGTRPRSELLLWRLPDLAPAGSHDLGDYQAFDLTPAPDGRSLAITGTNQTVDVRTADGSRSLWSIPLQTGSIQRVVISPDGRTMAVTHVDGDVQLWDTGTRAATAVLTGHTQGGISLAFSPDGRLLASSGTDEQTAVWQIDPAEAVRRLCGIAVPMSRNDGVKVSPLCS